MEMHLGAAQQGGLGHIVNTHIHPSPGPRIEPFENMLVSNPIVDTMSSRVGFSHKVPPSPQFLMGKVNWEGGKFKLPLCPLEATALTDPRLLNHFRVHIPWVYLYLYIC